MCHCSRLGGEYLLCLVEFRALQFFQALNLFNRQFGEQPQEATDIGVLGIAPVLPVAIGREHVGIEPHRARCRLAHLGARRGREQRTGQPVELCTVGAATEFDPVDDVAPLVGAAQLQRAAIFAVKLHEIIGLKDHVVEFEERQVLFPLKPDLHALEGQHPIDGEMAAIVAQEVDIFEIIEPVAVVDHDGIGLAGAECQELREYGLDAVEIRVDHFVGQQGARFVAKARVADPRCAAAHQCDRLVAGLLQPAQQHDLDQAAGVEARRRRIEADIARQQPFQQTLIEACIVGGLVDEPADGKLAQEVGLEAGHGRLGFRICLETRLVYHALAEGKMDKHP